MESQYTSATTRLDHHLNYMTMTNNTFLKLPHEFYQHQAINNFPIESSAALSDNHGQLQSMVNVGYDGSTMTTSTSSACYNISQLMSLNGPQMCSSEPLMLVDRSHPASVDILASKANSQMDTNHHNILHHQNIPIIGSNAPSGAVPPITCIQVNDHLDAPAANFQESRFRELLMDSLASASASVAVVSATRFDLFDMQEHPDHQLVEAAMNEIHPHFAVVHQTGSNMNTNPISTTTNTTACAGSLHQITSHDLNIFNSTHGSINSSSISSSYSNLIPIIGHYDDDNNNNSSSINIDNNINNMNYMDVASRSSILNAPNRSTTMSSVMSSQLAPRLNLGYSQNISTLGTNQGLIHGNLGNDIQGINNMNNMGNILNEEKSTRVISHHHHQSRSSTLCFGQVPTVVDHLQQNTMLNDQPSTPLSSSSSSSPMSAVTTTPLTLSMAAVMQGSNKNHQQLGLYSYNATTTQATTVTVNTVGNHGGGVSSPNNNVPSTIRHKKSSRHPLGPALNTNLKPRARQGSANDPQSIAARQRRERINTRLKVLQELVPNGSKVDLVTMLEKAINYVKFLQLQLKVLTDDEFWRNPQQILGSSTIDESMNDLKNNNETYSSPKSCTNV